MSSNAENPKIYIVTSDEYSEYRIDAVFTDIDLATRYVELHPDCDIAEWEANGKFDDPHPSLKRFRVCMDVDGNTRTKYRLTGPINVDFAGREKFFTGYGYYPDEVINEVRLETGWRRTVSRREMEWFQFLIWTKDLDHAIKIANDRRAQMIANNEWKPKQGFNFTFDVFVEDQRLTKEHLLDDVAALMQAQKEQGLYAEKNEEKV